jgi:hypothetical protein
VIFESPPIHPYASFWLDVADKILKALAVLVAAVWTYFRADTYRRKIEPSVSGELFSSDGQSYAQVVCSLKNLGESRYVLTQAGTYLSAQVLRPAGREDIPGSEIFKDHGWIEPGEQIDDPIVLCIPDPRTFVAIRLNLRVISRKVEWNASCILREGAPKTPAAQQTDKGDRHEVHHADAAAE